MNFDSLSHLLQLPKNFHEVGSIVPSSRFLAQDMVAPLRERGGQRRILEVGPGTGPITKEILHLMSPGDELFISEINKRFLEQLQKNLSDNKYYQRHRKRVTFIEGPIQQLRFQEPPSGFNCIVSSLPFSNFTPAMVQEIIDTFHYLLAPDGRLTFFEYLGVRKVSSIFASPKTRERLQGVDEILKDWRRSVRIKGSVKTRVSLLNFPPAVSVQLDY